MDKFLQCPQFDEDSLLCLLRWSSCLGPPVVPFYPFWGEGSPTKIDYSKKGTLIRTSLLEDLVVLFPGLYLHFARA